MRITEVNEVKYWDSSIETDNGELFFNFLYHGQFVPQSWDEPAEYPEIEITDMAYVGTHRDRQWPIKNINENLVQRMVDKVFEENPELSR